MRIVHRIVLCIFALLTVAPFHSSPTGRGAVAAAEEIEEDEDASAAAEAEEIEEEDEYDEEAEKKKRKKRLKKDMILFMYNNMTAEERYPIEEWGEPPIAEDGMPAQLLPDFLSGTKGYRVVEFYASWCPKCLHYKSYYIEFARNMTERAKKEYDLDITFHAISCTRHKKICRRRGVESYPKLELIPDGQKNGTLLSSWQLHPFTLFKEFGVLEEGMLSDEKEAEYAMLLEQAIESQRSAGGSGDGDDATINRFDKYPRSKETMYNDAYLSFDFAMRDGIFKSDVPLSQNVEVSEIFNAWIETINMALPPVWKLHEPVRVILDEWDEVVEDEENLISVVDRYMPPIETWSDSCKKGVDAMGYTCGLWYLFHIVTVGVVEWNSHTASASHRFPLEEVADHIADYIEEFFGCAECRHHFLAAYEACAFHRCHRLGENTADDTDWKQLPLWLWETHNAVNVRLMKERAAREGTPEVERKLVEWPSREACPLCWKDDIGWYDPDVVWKYLRMEYWPDDAETRSFREELLESIKSGGSGTSTNPEAGSTNPEAEVLSTDSVVEDEL